MTNKRIGQRQAVRGANDQRTETSSGDDLTTEAAAEEMLRESHGRGDKPLEVRDDHVRRDAIRQRDPETHDRSPKERETPRD